MEKKLNEEQLLKELAVKYGYSGLFYTPKDMSEIQNWIERHSSGEKAHLYTVLGMTSNLYAGLIAQIVAEAQNEEVL